MTYADDIKVRLLSWLLPQLEADEIVASEVPFDDGTFRADLLIVSPSRLEAIEIKGPRDDLRKLQRQIEGYGNMFLSVSVVVDRKHIVAAREMLPRSTGILEVTTHVRRTRKATSKQVLRKDAAVRWLQGQQLHRALRNAGYSMDRRSTVDELRGEAVRLLPANTLTTFAVDAILERCRKRFDIFVREMGKTLTLDDLRTLSIGSIIV